MNTDLGTQVYQQKGVSMSPIELTIIIISLIVALAVPWPGVPDPWKPSGYSIVRWLLSVVLVFMLCMQWLKH